MRRSIAIRAAVAVSALLAGSVAGMSTAAAQALTWTVTPAATPAGQSSQLISEACPPQNQDLCLAVGSLTQQAGAPVTPLIEESNGGSWVQPSTPGLTSLNGAAPTFAKLVSISCASQSFCPAVGYANYSDGSSHALMEDWDGGFWAFAGGDLPLPAGNSSLSAVSCSSSTFCMAIGGSDGGPFSAVYTGASTWTLGTGPDAVAGASITALACVSSTACYAAGYVPSNGADLTVVEGWDGTTWTQMQSGNPSANSFLLGIGCDAAGDCTAVGYYGLASGDAASLVETWNGTSWKPVPSPNPTSPDVGLNAVTCLSATDCLAVGRYFLSGSGYQTLVEGFDGTAWSIQPSPSPEATNILQGVACVTASFCTTVGFQAPATGGNAPLAEQGNLNTATSTSLAASPNPAVVGQSVAYQATVTPAPDTGTVTFYDGGTPIPNCSGLAVGNGTGSAGCSVVYSSPGTHSITASYSGSSTFAPSSAGPITETVQQAATSTTMTLNPATTIVGQPVSLTATVSVQAPGVATPSGTVSFLDAGTPISACGTPAVQGNTATCTVSSLGVGAHNLSAQYNGDADTLSSASTFTTEYVGYAIALLYNPSTPVRAGSQYTFKIELQDASGNDLSRSTIVVTAACVVVQPQTDCNASLRTLNQAFSFVSSRKSPPSYSYTLNTKGLAAGSYDLVVSVAGDPTAHALPFTLG